MKNKACKKAMNVVYCKESIDHVSDYAPIRYEMTFDTSMRVFI